MKLINFLNDLFKEDGFILIDYNSNRYVIGKPLKEVPIELQLLEKVCIKNYFSIQIYILVKHIPMAL